MADSSIEWTEKTWNPTTGCDRISPGCENCYALKMAKRLKGMGQAKYQTDGNPVTSGPGFGLAVHPDSLAEPLKWAKPTTVFVNSMSDLFHARVPREFIARVFAVMAATPQHTYQILTKRPERAARLLGNDGVSLLDAAPDEEAAQALYDQWPLPNAWMGTSVESADYLRRIDDLRETPAAVRFVSAEPLLGPLDGINLTGVDWLIAGGESGPGSREMDLGWVRHLRDACADAGTAFFMKQMGSVWAQQAGHPGKGNHPEFWPADLNVREYPTPTAVPA